MISKAPSSARGLEVNCFSVSEGVIPRRAGVYVRKNEVAVTLEKMNS